MADLRFLHVDVFAPQPYSGNSLPVFYDAPDLDDEALLTITRELRHFEAVFLQPRSDRRVARARVFDLISELGFAGHPLLGAAVALEHLHHRGEGGTWRLDVGSRAINVEVLSTEGRYFALMDQGSPVFSGEIGQKEEVAMRFALQATDIHERLPIEVGSTGLRYLVVPLAPGAIERARISTDISDLVERHGADFAVLFDVDADEIRHWNNDGVIEDVATGSAAGVVASYMARHGLAAIGERRVLHQGRFVGRASQLEVRIDDIGAGGWSVKVGGPVSLVGNGSIDHAPKAVPGAVPSAASGR